MTSSKLPWLTRSAGILMHPTSLPGPFGIGDLGPTARAWIDTLAATGITWWQILPLGPTGQGDSPYAALSAFAGNPLLISPELLARDGLASAADLQSAKFPGPRIDFGNVQKFKWWLVDKAGDSFRGGVTPALNSKFEQFCHSQSDWLDDFALYAALKDVHGGGDFRGWPATLVRRDSAALAIARRDLAPAVDRHRFRQFLFFRQWADLKRYANSKGVRILGDAPIFVAADSADSWAHPELFLLGKDGKPNVVAGVPPDYFSKTGQLWGNPLYDWPAQKKTGYRWWVARLKSLLTMVDAVRLDHFRGFEAAWHVPAGSKTAETGQWLPGPGKELFDVLTRKLGGLPIVAEDLGLITKEVDALRDGVGLPGMRILQFAFGGDPNAKFLPHNFDRNTVVYTGTHDNDTTLGWFANLSESERKFCATYSPAVAAQPAAELIRLAWTSIADLAIAPLQDVLNLGNDARMNVPGVADGNWSWRVNDKQLNRNAYDQLGELTWATGRKAPVPQAPQQNGESKSNEPN